MTDPSTETARGVAQVPVVRRPDPPLLLLVVPAQRGHEQLWQHLCDAVRTYPAGAPVQLDQTPCESCTVPGGWRRLFRTVK